MSKYPRTGKRGAPQAFARKLFEILSHESPSVISWSESGDSFFIHDVEEFVNNVLLKYFRHQKFSSFQRQLNLYGFRKVHKGPDTGGYTHQFFKRGRPELLDVIRRSPQSSSRSRSSRQRQPSYDDENEAEEEEESREEDDEDAYSNPSEQTPSCMSSLTTYFVSTGAYNTRAARAAGIPPPPSYDDVLKADLGMSTGVQPGAQRLKRGLSDEHTCEQPPQQIQKPQCTAATTASTSTPASVTAAAPPGLMCFSTMNFNATLFSDDVFHKQLQEMDEYNGPFDFSSDHEWIEPVKEDSAGVDKVGQQLSSFHFPAGVEQYYGGATGQPQQAQSQPLFQHLQQPQQPPQKLPRPAFNRVLSTQSQEWDIDNSLANEIDFDEILALADPGPLPAAHPIGYRASYPVVKAEAVSAYPAHGARVSPRSTQHGTANTRPLPSVPCVPVSFYSPQR